MIGKEYSLQLLIPSLLHALMHADPLLVFSLPPLGASLWQDLRASQINVHLCCPEVGSLSLFPSVCCLSRFLQGLLEVGAHQWHLLFRPLSQWDVPLVGPVKELLPGCHSLHSSCHR
jgi:hypothetical protein